MPPELVVPYNVPFKAVKLASGTTIAFAIVKLYDQVFFTVRGHAENGAAAAGAGASGARYRPQELFRTMFRSRQLRRHRQRTAAAAREAIEDVLFACRAEDEYRSLIRRSP